LIDFYLYANPSWIVYKDTHNHPSGNPNPSGWNGDLGHGEHILKQSPNARFFIFTNPNKFTEYSIPKRQK